MSRQIRVTPISPASPHFHAYALASDLHLSSGNPPILRISGELHRVDYPPLESDVLKAMLYEITPEYKVKVYEESGDVDFGYEIPGVSRFRANFFNQKYGVAAVFRQIPSKVLSFEDFEKFDAPLPPVLKKLTMLHKGMVLVTGPTGSGKSTTLAAMIDYANKNRKDHILTIEDPIEFVHESKSALVNHREVGIHTRSFSAALKGALREDPDIILVGEMRDLETIELALTAASTGHLVFGTLHTQSAAKTVDRIIDVFPADQQNKIRATQMGRAGDSGVTMEVGWGRGTLALTLALSPGRGKCARTSRELLELIDGGLGSGSVIALDCLGDLAHRLPRLRPDSGPVQGGQRQLECSGIGEAGQGGQRELPVFIVARRRQELAVALEQRLAGAGVLFVREPHQAAERECAVDFALRLLIEARQGVPGRQLRPVRERANGRVPDLGDCFERGGL
jgi:pilus retraction protein PilT